MDTRIIEIETKEDMDAIQVLFGANDTHVRSIEKKYLVSVVLRDSEVRISGEEGKVEKAEKAFSTLLSLTKSQKDMDHQKVDYVCSLTDEGEEKAALSLESDVICHTI